MKTLAYKINNNPSENKIDKNRSPFCLSESFDLQEYELDPRFAKGIYDEQQYLLKFEQVMDSKISQKIIPFLIIEKNIRAV
jgi:hypothetical protein